MDFKDVYNYTIYSTISNALYIEDSACMPWQDVSYNFKLNTIKFNRFNRSTSYRMCLKFVPAEVGTIEIKQAVVVGLNVWTVGVFVSPKLEKGYSDGRSTKFGGEDEAGYCAVIIPERSDSISPSSYDCSTFVVPIPIPTLASTTTPSAATSPKSQPEYETLNQVNDNSHSESSSSISPVFAHSPNKSDLAMMNNNHHSYTHPIDIWMAQRYQSTRLWWIFSRQQDGSPTS